MGFRKLSARPRHDAHNEPAAAAFKKSSPPSWRTSRAASARIEIWFHDEARVGQKNKITRRWARRG
ncbi:MAG: IS630 family transposase, partial [Alphaproteobacteria bacterium]